MNISEINYDLSFLSQEFPDFTFQLFQSHPATYINCFVCNVTDESKLLSQWRDVTGVIAGDFQSRLEDEFSVWNIYLIFCTSFEVSNITKYEIENNRFSMRKLVTSQCLWEHGCDIEKFINNEILCSDLELSNNFYYSSNNDFKSDLHTEILSICELDDTDSESYEKRLEQISYLQKWIIKHEN